MKDPKDTETGVANAAGVVPGQRLLEIDIALPDPRQLKLIRRVGRWEGGKGGKGKRSQNGGWSQPYTEWKGSWVSSNYVYPFLVVRTETVDLADIKLKWESVKVEDMVDIPKCFSDWDCTAAPHRQDRFLVFTARWASLPQKIRLLQQPRRMQDCRFPAG